MRLGFVGRRRSGGVGGTVLRGGARGGGLLAGVATRLAWRLLGRAVRGGVRGLLVGAVRGLLRAAFRVVARGAVPAALWVLKRALLAAVPLLIGVVVAAVGGAIWIALERRGRA